MTLDLDAIEARVNAATPGPWKRGREEPEDNGRWIVHTAKYKSETVVAVRADVCHPYADSEFIAHCRDDVPALLAEVRRLNTALDHTRLQSELSAATLDKAGASVRLSHALLRDAISCIRNPTHTMVDLREYADRLEKALGDK